MSIVIPIISEFNSKGIDRARKEFGQLETVGQKAQYGISAASAALVGSLGAVTAAVGHAIKAAGEDQKSQEQLKIALQNTTGATDFQVKAVEDAITQMMYQTATADDELRPALGKLVRATGDVTQAQKLLALGLDISAGSGKSLDAVTTALSKAALGNFTALKRLGIPLDENAVKMKDLDAITAQLGASFAGAAKKNAQTFEGQMKTLKIAMSELEEAVGMKVIPILSDYASVLLDLVGKTQDVDTPTSKWFGRLLDLGKIVFPLARGIEFLNDKIRGQAEDLKQNGRQMSQGHALIKTTTELVYGVTEATKRSTSATKASTEADAKAKALKDKLAAAAKKVSEAAKQLEADLKTARDALTEQFAVALKGVTEKLDAAKAKFDDFSATVSGVFTNALNFKDAYDLGVKSTEGFLSGLTSQVDKIKKFGELTNRLIAGGLSQDALKLVLDAGVDTGTKIAEELLNGAGNILTANALVADAKTMADKVGLNAANAYFKAGVDAATAMVQGMQSVIDKYTPMMNAPGISPSGVASLGASFGAETSGNFDPSVIGSLDWAAIFKGITFDLSGITALASGGIVTSPQLAIIGEAGPEAVVPLDRMGSMGGGASVTINVNGGDPNAVVDALRTYMFRNGSIPIRVSG